MREVVNFIRTGLLAGLMALALSLEGTVAVGQTPTYSIEAIEVNGIPVPGGPAHHVTVTVGDVITAKFFVRDWSPNGEILRAYQLKIDDASYATGEQGVVQPVDFQMNPDMDPNAFIDESDPQWVHRGLPTIPLTDTVNLGYRWLSVLIDPSRAPASAQDGKKYSCGTVKLKPSPNATGTFTIALAEDASVSYLLSMENEQILPMEYERLVVDVQPTTRWRRVLSSDPPDGSVDARRPSKSASSAGSWSTFRLAFNSDCGQLTPDDFTVDDGAPNPPRIQRVSARGATLAVTLDRPIRLGAWTTITHKNSGTFTRLGCFPGDVNHDGKADAADLIILLDALNGGRKLADYQADIDGNGKLGPGDVLQLLDVISEARVRPKTSGPTRKAVVTPAKSP